MSHRGRLIFVCFLLGAACVSLQARCGKQAKAAAANAALQDKAALQTPAAPPASRRPCLNVGAVSDARYCGGLRNAPGKERLSEGQLNRVLLSLREKTGWRSLKFDEEGFLVCPDPNVFNGGSDAARRLLGDAIFSDKAFYLAAHNRSPEVLFARLAVEINYEDHLTGVKLSARPLQIDFADFSQLRGGDPALKAFDLGIAILHELAHGVWRLRDAAPGEERLGECEIFINRIRRELRLPERQSYIARVRSRHDRLIAELRFIRASEKQGRAKKERFLLEWEAQEVGVIADLGRAAKPVMSETFR